MSNQKPVLITKRLFDNHRIRLIQAEPNGDALLILWFKLLSLSQIKEDKNVIRLNQSDPYTNEQLAVVTNTPLSLIEEGLVLFELLKMIYIYYGYINILNWEKECVED